MNSRNVADLPVVKFCSIEKDMVVFWKKEFSGLNRVEVIEGDMFSQVADAIVSPGNSFGLMDAGIDKLICEHFGVKIEQNLQRIIKKEYYGELVVGNAIIIKTNNEKIPYFISAPTMRAPMRLGESVNPYLAVRAVFIAIIEHNSHIKNRKKRISSVIIPGMGIGTGKMPREIVAKQMKEAYDSIILGKKSFPKDWKEARASHNVLVGKTEESTRLRSLSVNRRDHGVFE
jgi:O-acetyl-ADP-ribose deacetylase (regulator of RNase III)